MMNITNTPDLKEGEPMWSPDGRKIAFSGWGELGDIYVMNTDGSNPINLTNSPHCSEEHHTWSPDGLKIAYIRSSGSEDFIYVMSADGTNQTQLSSGLRDNYPHWSPDGTKIVFTKAMEPHQPIGHGQIFVMNANGTDEQRLTYSDLDDFCPSWSPDGAKIMFLSTREGNYMRAQIFVMDADGSNQTNITNNIYRHSSCRWSPDGTQIVLMELNKAPVADAGLDQTVECTCQTTNKTQVTLNGIGSYDPDGNPLTYKWTGSFWGSPLIGPNPTPTVTLEPGCVGTYNIKLVVNDGQVDSETDTVIITVQDTTPPVVSLNGPANIALECKIDNYTEYGATVSDNCDSAVPLLIGGDIVDISICGTYIVTYNATDDNGNPATEVIRTVIVQDTIPPDITIVAPEPYSLYAAGDLELDFSAYDLVSGNIVPPALSGTMIDAAGYSGPVALGYIPGAGVYTLEVIAEDEAGNNAEETVYFVVYDAIGGFVTGGGWIDSPEGAYTPDPSLSGKANFGFISKYKKGATVPTGQTEFVFKADDLNFHSSSYDWLVVTGSNYARFKGTGTINGYGEYSFLLWAGDDPDTFRIKIWWEDGELENVVYDNAMDQDIGGGSIVVHTN